MATEFYNRNWRMPKSSNSNKVSNYSMSFDGSSERIVIPYSDIFNQSVYSFSFWINNSSNSGVSNDGIITADSSNRGFAILQDNQTLKFNPNILGVTGQIDTSNFFNTIDTWIHCVITFDGTNLIVYKNGISVNTSTTGNRNLNANNNNLTIGDSQIAAGREFNGKLDHLAIFDYALTDGTGGTVNQIAELYGNSTDGVGNPMAISPIPKAYYPIGDYAAFNGSEYLVNNGALQDYVFNFGEKVENEYIELPQLPSFTSITVSAWIKTQKTTTRQTIIGNNGQTAAQRGWDLRLGKWDGSGYSRAEFTFYNSDGSANTAVEQTLSQSLADNQWHHIAALWDGTTGANAVKIFVDGLLAGQGTSSFAGPISQPPAIFEPRIGMRGFSSSGGGGGWNIGGNTGEDGFISNAQIWDSSLTFGIASTVGDTAGGQIAELYNNGTPYTGTQPESSNLQAWWKLDASATFDGSNWSIPDDSSNSNTGTSNGMTAANLVQSTLNITTPYSRYALDFDGTNDYIDCGNDSSLNITSTITLSAWVKPTTTITSQNFPMFIAKGINSDYMLFANSGTGTARLRLGSSFLIDSILTISTNVWTHIVGTYDGSNLKIYLNGSLDNTVPQSGAIPSTSGSLQIAAANTGNKLNGQLSNVSIWNAALTSTQATEIYNEGKPGNLNTHSAYSNLVSWWQLGENSSFDGANWTVLDEKGTNNGTSANMTEADLVNGVGTSANGLSSGMGGADNIIGDAPYSTANAVSYGMGVDALSTDVPS